MGKRRLACAALPLILSAMNSPVSTLSITVNGQHRRILAGSSIVDLALELGLDPQRVAMERNLEIVPRSTFGQMMVEDGDAYEIVHFVGGG